jgi:tRNA(Ile)-lysidine synthase
MTPAAFLAAVRRTMHRRGMDGDSKTLVACSGGPDSLALLHALHRLGADLVVAHFDHKVRPGSEQDARFVEQRARDLGVPFILGERREDLDPKASPEEGLRALRLAFLQRAAASSGAARIATGHTRDDQAETVLMRLVSGTGRRGLGGIAPVRGPFIRPLIDLRRADVEGFCKALDLEPRRDPTNADLALRRNAVRAELLPFIAGRFNVRVTEALARLADVVRDEDAWLDEQAGLALEPDHAGEEIRIPALELAKLPAALQRRVIKLAVPGATHEEVERMRLLALEGTTGGTVDLGATLNARLEYGFLLVGPGSSMDANTATIEIRVPGETDAWGWRVRTWLTEAPPVCFPDGRTTCALDASHSPTPLEWRAPRTGDRFRPLGMTRSKKLGDFFTDAKVPQAKRPRTPVIASGDEIIWVVGHRPGDRFKVTEVTKRVLWLEALPATRRGET